MEKKSTPHFINFCDFRESEKTLILLRPFFRHTPDLFSRLRSKPNLGQQTSLERLWIIFQLVFATYELFAESERLHGDLKSENVFVTAGNEVLITDPAWMKPLYVKDLCEYSFFFESTSELGCYLAPERFRKKSSDDTKFDVFSLGCLVAEICLGRKVLQLADVLNYCGIPEIDKVDLKIRNLILKMTAKDPNERPSLDEVLEDELFPKSFRNLHLPLSFIFKKLSHEVRICFLRLRFSELLSRIDEKDPFSPMIKTRSDFKTVSERSSKRIRGFSATPGACTVKC